LVFVAWVVFTYLFAFIAALVTQYSMKHQFPFDLFAAARLHAAMLAAACFVAGVACPAIWLIPSRRRVILIPLGAAFGFAAVFIMVALLIALYGGFEANMGWFSLGLAVVIPSVVSGAIAGYYKPLHSPIARPSAWWPSSPTDSE
jgi:hypothetical protein